MQKNGTVHVVWDSLACGANCTDERMWYTRSTNGGVSWSAAVQVRDFNLVGFSGANKPPVADQRGIGPFGAIDVDNSGGACDGTLYATFSDWTSGGATETDVWVSRSTNNGATWSAPVKVNDDGLANRTQFHPFLQVDQSNGSVVVVWHDARNDTNNRKVDYLHGALDQLRRELRGQRQGQRSRRREFNNSGISYSDENTDRQPEPQPQPVRRVHGPRRQERQGLPGLGRHPALLPRLVHQRPEGERGLRDRRLRRCAQPAATTCAKAPRPATAPTSPASPA